MTTQQTQSNCDRIVNAHVHQNVSYLVQELSHMAKYRDELLEVQVKFNHNEDLFEEALEHWCVSAWLGERLKEEGEMVIDFLGLTIWGRTTSGQAIMLDSVVEDIYNKHYV